MAAAGVVTAAPMEENSERSALPIEPRHIAGLLIAASEESFPVTVAEHEVPVADTITTASQMSHSTSTLPVVDSDGSLANLRGASGSVATETHGTAASSLVAVPLPSSSSSSVSEVTKFLRANNLATYAAAMQENGYDDIEDLLDLIQPHNTSLFEGLVPKPGHRSKLIRLVLSAIQQPNLVRSRQGSLDGTAAATAAAPLCYPGSSRTTLLGDSDDDGRGSYRESVASSAVAPAGFALAGGPAHFPSSRQQQQVPKVLSYVHLLEDGTQNHIIGGGSGAVPSGAGGASVTPSPSPQRCDTSTAQGRPSYGNAPSKPIFLERPPRSSLHAGAPSGSTQRPGYSRSPVRGSSTAGGLRPQGSSLAAGREDDVCSTNSFCGSSSSSGRDLQHLKMKVVVVGMPGCGKTTLIHRLVKNEFAANAKPTIGVEFSEKKFQVGDCVVALHFWDIWGQEATVNATRSYYLGAKSALVVYDACNEESLNKAIQWKKDLEMKSKPLPNGDPLPVFLVGNKYDLAVSAPTPKGVGGAVVTSSPAVRSKCVLKSQDAVDALCAEHRFAGHYFTSAKTGEAVRQVAEALVLVGHRLIIASAASIAGQASDLLGVSSSSRSLSAARVAGADESNPKVVSLEPNGVGNARGGGRSGARGGSGGGSSTTDQRNKKKFRCSML